MKWRGRRESKNIQEVQPMSDVSIWLREQPGVWSSHEMVPPPEGQDYRPGGELDEMTKSANAFLKRTKQEADVQRFRDPDYSWRDMNRFELSDFAKNHLRAYTHSNFADGGMVMGPQRGVDYWTPEDTPFFSGDDLFRGLGSMARGLFVPREADLRRFPRFTQDPRLNIPISGNRASERQKQKRLADAAKKAAKARAALDLELETTGIGRMMRLEDADARRNAMRMPIDPRNQPPTGFPGVLPLSPPSLQTELETSEMGRVMKLQEQDARYQRAAAAAFGAGAGFGAASPGAASVPGLPAGMAAGAAGGGTAPPFMPDNIPIDPREHAAAQLANADDARLAARGAPPPSRAGIAALGGANTGLPFAPVNAAQPLPEAQGVTPAYTTDMFGNVVPLTDATGAQVKPRQHMGGTYMPVPMLPSAPVGPAQSALVPYTDDPFVGRNVMPYMDFASEIGGPQHLGPEHFTSGPEDMFVAEPGHDPDALSNQLYRYITKRDQAGGFSALGRDLNRAGNKAQDWLDHAVEKSGEKIESYFTPKGPGGRTPAGEDLIAAGDKVQSLMDYMETVPVPKAFNPWNWDFGGKDEPPPIDPSLYPEEEIPAEEDVAGEDGKKNGTGSLDSAIEKYLTESDTTYDDALKTIKHAYGDMDTDYKNPKQDAADAYMAREGERTAALAQLAVAGGLFKSAGKSWEGVGQGILDSAGVYSQGFDRYQRALNESADRYDERQKDNRALELAQRGAALTMWQSGQTDRRALMRELFTQARDDAKAAATERREDRKFTIESINKRFEGEQTVLFPKEGTGEPATPEQRADFYDRWDISTRLRRPVSEEEFRVMKARAAAKAAAKASGKVKMDVSD